MYKKLLILLTFATPLSALGTPDQLDILGLVPGVSDKAQIQKVAIDSGNIAEGVVKLEVGGHKIPCVFELLDEKLADLQCFTGKGNGKREIYTEASNFEVHTDLLAGFTRKFGKPDQTKVNPVRTRVGVDYERSWVSWFDKRGNKLTLISIMENVDGGAITLESAESLAKAAAELADKNARKKF